MTHTCGYHNHWIEFDNYGGPLKFLSFGHFWPPFEKSRTPKQPKNNIHMSLFAKNMTRPLSMATMTCKIQ